MPCSWSEENSKSLNALSSYSKSGTAGDVEVARQRCELDVHKALACPSCFQFLGSLVRRFVWWTLVTHQSMYFKEYEHWAAFSFNALALFGYFKKLSVGFPCVYLWMFVSSHFPAYLGHWVACGQICSAVLLCWGNMVRSQPLDQLGSPNMCPCVIYTCLSLTKLFYANMGQCRCRTGQTLLLKKNSDANLENWVCDIRSALVLS